MTYDPRNDPEEVLRLIASAHLERKVVVAADADEGARQLAAEIESARSQRREEEAIRKPAKAVQKKVDKPGYTIGTPRPGRLSEKVFLEEAMPQLFRRAIAEMNPSEVAEYAKAHIGPMAPVLVEKTVRADREDVRKKHIEQSAKGGSAPRQGTKKQRIEAVFQADPDLIHTKGVAESIARECKCGRTLVYNVQNSLKGKVL